MSLNEASGTRRRTRRGTAMVEATLTLPLFLVLIFSLFDFGWILFQHQTIQNQARRAARYGAVNPENLTEIQNVLLYGNKAGTGSPLFGLSRSNVSVTRAGLGTAADRIDINVSGYRFGVISLALPGSFTGKPIQVSMPVEN